MYVLSFTKPVPSKPGSEFCDFARVAAVVEADFDEQAVVAANHLIKQSQIGPYVASVDSLIFIDDKTHRRLDNKVDDLGILIKVK